MYLLNHENNLETAVYSAEPQENIWHNRFECHAATEVWEKFADSEIMDCTCCVLANRKDYATTAPIMFARNLWTNSTWISLDQKKLLLRMKIDRLWLSSIISME
jgi:hypothetical protein